MSATLKIFKDFTESFTLATGPDSPSFLEVWQAYTSVVGLVGVNLMNKNVGSHVDAANEVRMHLERHLKVESIAKDMPLKVPAPVLRAVRVWGSYYEKNKELAEYMEFISITPSIIDRFIVYAEEELNKMSIPVTSALKTVARSASLMGDCVRAELEPFMLEGF